MKALLEFPNLINEWNLERNGDLKPDKFHENSRVKVWWKCKLGHEWEAYISNRTRGNNCPYCMGKKVLKGFNDLETVNPILSSEWNYENNKNMIPSMFLPSVAQKVWWKCNKCGNEWEATLNARSRGQGCPKCGLLKQQESARRNAVKKKGSFAEHFPDLANEWNYDRNGEFTPQMFTTGSREVVWWRCALGHEWKDLILNRTKGIGCPYCSNREVFKGFNDLESVYPNIAKTWNCEKNGILSPDSVLFFATEKYGGNVN